MLRVLHELDATPWRCNRNFVLLTPDDAPALVDFVDYAGSACRWTVWAALAGPGNDARAVGVRMARGEGAPISYRSAVVADERDGSMQRFGFRLAATRPMAVGSSANPGKQWLLLIRRR